MGNLPSDTTLTVRLPEALKKWAQSAADDREISLSEIVKIALYAYLDLYSEPRPDEYELELQRRITEQLTTAGWGEIFEEFFDNVLAEQEQEQAPF